MINFLTLARMLNFLTSNPQPTFLTRREKKKLYDISNLKLSELSRVKHLDLQYFIFRALFCVSLVLKVISFNCVAVLICSVAIFC
jgi:hypothetical protein